MDMLDKSIIVAAHPDDENLWFSSILSRVDQIVLCFLPVPSEPNWTRGRRMSLSSYPLKNMSCLELTESGVFWGADWSRPVPTEYGLQITEQGLSDRVYVENYAILKSRLRERLRGCRNVFTHNPWGEYGHVEHVQVYCAVKALQQEMDFNLWFPNYVSNKSANLMLRTLPFLDPEVVTVRTDRVLAARIADLYKANGCWTWYDDYQWGEEEAFLKDVASSERRIFGSLLPLNFIRIEEPQIQLSQLERLRRKCVKGFKRLLFPGVRNS